MPDSIFQRYLVHQDQEIETAIESASEGDSTIYFLRNLDTGLIKVGCSAHVRDRMQDLKSHMDARFELLGAIPGDFDLENLLHRKFDHYRMRYRGTGANDSDCVHREWFRPSETVLSYINQLLDKWACDI